jgi:hypothetical protein
MKKSILWLGLSIAVLGCSQPQKPAEEVPSKSDEAMIQYEKNLGVLKASLTAFENEQIDEWANSLADNAVWNPASYGAPAGTKEDWKKTLTYYVTEWDSLRLTNPTFLPGIDSASHEPDGSVRYYGTWVGVHKSGMKTSINYYATLEFNNDNKVITASEFMDIGGLLNAIATKSGKK